MFVFLVLLLCLRLRQITARKKGHIFLRIYAYLVQKEKRSNVSFLRLFTVWREVEYPDFAIDNTSNVMVTPDGNGVNITLNSPTQCSDVDVAPVDAVIISVPGNWKRIKFRQTFMETQQCYAVFGSVPSW